MREHMGLFRGKRIDNGEWVEGALIPWKDGDAEICASATDNANEMDKFLVDSTTIGECTSLKDKNGKLIFEGDIIDCWSEGVNAQGTVQQNKGGLWIIYPAWQKRIMWGLCPDEFSNTDVEIIGNIHDNPELLKGSEG